MIKLVQRIHIKPKSNPKSKPARFITLPEPIKKEPKLICNYINCQYIDYEKMIPEDVYSTIHKENISICENCNYYLYTNNHKE